METFATGWLPDFPDIRDYTMDTEEVKPIFAAVCKNGTTPQSTVDLREWFSPVENQGSIGSCTAHAAIGLLEYCERRAFGKHVDASRLFTYKVTRKLMGVTGDTGAFLRTVMGALTMFGAPPEKFYPYVEAKYDDEPDQFVYALARNYQATKYVRLDPPGSTRAQLMEGIKANLCNGLPSMFGFSVYRSLYNPDVSKSGKIPYPAKGEKGDGGHAIVCCGYIDDMEIINPYDMHKTKGAFIIRNSWGTGWGNQGYGFLPYEYVEKGIAIDWWTLINAEWVDTNQFGV